MKKIKLLIIVLFIALLSGCEGSSNMEKGETRFLYEANVVDPDNIVNNYDVIEIDGCEYIVYTETHGYGGYGFMTHKGNCKNPIHKH